MKTRLDTDCASDELGRSRGPTIFLWLALVAVVGGCDKTVSMAVEPALDAGGDADPVPPADGALPPEAGVDANTAPEICDPVRGLVAPLPACSPETPCNRPAAELNGVVLTIPSSPPACPPGMTLNESDVAGFHRYACVASPAGASASSKRPLVVWFHGGGEGAATVDETGLVARSASFDLTADPLRLGFHLAVVQGRNLRFPVMGARDGRHHDFYHRDLGSPSTNPDIAFADSIVDRFVASGTVDGKRIFVMGWSNGGFFGQLYAIARRDTSTPAGSRVAAAAVFAAGNPFEDVRWDPFAGVARAGTVSCRLAALPSSSVPILLAYRTCDAAVAVTPAQAACFDTEPGYTIEPWLAQASTAGLSMTPLRIGGREPGATLDALAVGATAPACTSTACGVNPPYSAGCLCMVNHLMWPDGAYGNTSTGIDHEASMLEFLRGHGLP